MVMRTLDRRVIIVLVTGAFAAGCTLLSSEERKIARRLDGLADRVSADSEENPVIQMAGAARLGQYFTEDVVIDVGGGSEPIRRRDSVTALAAQARAAIQGLKVNFEDVDITVSASDTATAHLTLVVSGRERNRAASSPDAGSTGAGVQGGGGPGLGLQGVGAPSLGFDARELAITFKQVDGEWFIAHVEILKTLERPQ